MSSESKTHLFRGIENASPEGTKSKGRSRPLLVVNGVVGPL